jgi:DNA (cytosine-5)-methyltransferase 1
VARISLLQHPRFIAVDFFCGAGGTTRGLIDAGGYVIAGIDKDSKVARTYRENNRNRHLDRAMPEFLDKDIFPATRGHANGRQAELMVELGRLLRAAKLKAPGIPVLFAICAPCQPFTTLAKKALSEERRSGRRKDRWLLKEAAKFVKKFKPDFVLSENVAGIGEKKYGGVWQAFRDQLDELNYGTGAKVVDASRFGVPQYRKRSILIAARKPLITKHRLTEDNELLVPEADPDSEIVTVQEAIGHFPPLGPGESFDGIPNHRTRDLSELNRRRMTNAKPGESNGYMQTTRHGDLSLRCHRKVNKKFSQRCFGDVYTRMRPDRPAPTITTKCHSVTNGRFGHFDKKQVRGISVREAAALQSFPDDYVFYPTHQVEPVARMIGNAVPPKLARFFATYLVNSVISAAAR